MKNLSVLNSRAIELSRNYLRCEKALLGVLIEMAEERAFLELGYTGIFNYCLMALKFSESQAAYFSSVARKSREVPELKQAIDSGVLSVSKARRIVSVITPETQKEWIAKAAELPQRELERHVAAVNPASVRERVRPVSIDRHEVRLSISDGCRRKLERVRDLMKQQGLDAVLEKLLDTYIDKHDPVKKAERAVLRKVKPSIAKKTMPAQVRHQVNLRDRGECQICGEGRFTELHHIKLQARGGAHTAENLATLCSGHHKLRHLR